MLIVTQVAETLSTTMVQKLLQSEDVTLWECGLRVDSEVRALYNNRNLKQQTSNTTYWHMYG